MPRQKSHSSLSNLNIKLFAAHIRHYEFWDVWFGKSKLQSTGEHGTDTSPTADAPPPRVGKLLLAASHLLVVATRPKNGEG